MATMAISMAQAPSLSLAPHNCPNCGFSSEIPLDNDALLAAAQKQILDLQAQVRLLNQKATAAVDRWADYEDELAKLRRHVASTTRPPSRGVTIIHDSPPKAATLPRAMAAPLPQPAPQTPTTSSFLAGGRLSALLSPRSAKSTPNLKDAQPRAVPPTTPGARMPETPTTPSTDDLLTALSREQTLRRQAEDRLGDTSREVEELSAQLFEQANEMVASERRARAKLEERVSVLEKRDVEKRQRLERLESAMARIERVRALLGEVGPLPSSPLAAL
jgi:septal ring factor EnvC (AmiA/AmiB activator)